MKKIFSVLVMLSMVTSTFSAFPSLAIARENDDKPKETKVNICHKDGNSGNWNALNIDENGWGGHSGHQYDYLYGGPTKDGKPDGKDHKDDKWCKDHAPEPEEEQGSFTVKKVIIGGEADYSDFSFSVNGGEPISFEEDGQNDLTLNDGKYTITEAPAPANYDVTYNGCEDIQVSHENDEEETPICTITNTYVPACNANASASYVSGITTEVSEGGNAVLLSPTHPAWTASIPGASWIWTTNPVENPTNDGDLTKVFVQHFTIVGTPTGGTLDVAADNSYSVKVNGNVVPVVFDQDNFQSSTQDSYNIGAFLVSGVNTIEFTVTNWESTEQSADPAANPAGLMYKVSVQNNECGNPEPEPTPTATLIATKIVCDSESDLPNWGNGGPDITASTASTFISEHPNCHVEPGWQFMWSLDGVANPGDNNLSDSISGWNTFGLTDTSGSVSTSIPSGGKIWVREVLKDGYIPFTFPANPDNSDNISAELYCNTDVLNYDNWDWIDPVVGNTTYNCLAFNAPKLTPPPTECPLVDTPSSGWYSQYYNFKATDPFMQDGEVNWSTDRGNPADSLSDSHEWYTPKFYKFNKVDSNLMFGSNFYPFDVAPYNVAPYADPSQRINSHEYHFGVHSSAKVIAPVTGNYAYTLSSDDDAWVLVDGVVQVDNHGIHAASTQSGSISMTAGTHIVDVYFAERHTVSSELSFEFTDKSLSISPYSPLCQSEVPVCDANVELIQNGSFEDPAMGSGTWGVVPDSNPALKWLVAWFNPLTSGVLGLEIQNHVAGNPDPGLGDQFAELDGYHPVNISQNISTTPGMNYALTFKYSPRPGRDSADNALEAQAGGLVLGSSITADGTSNTDTVWTSYTRNFTATTTSTVIGFNDIGTDTSYGGYIDGVSLRCVSPETPHEPTNGHVHIFKYIDGEQANIINAVSASFPMFTATYNAPFTLSPSGWTNGDEPYEASTSEMPAGATYTANENLDTSLVGASCQEGKQYELVGYSSGSSLSEAQNATKSLTPPVFTIDGESYMIVWNHKCGEVQGATTLKVHIYKYLDNGDGISQVSDNANVPAFPMTATWQTANLNSGVSSSGSYVLGDNHGGATLKYSADTAPMEAPADYTTSEVVDGAVVVSNSQACEVGKYYLLGYKSGNDLSSALSATLTETAPVFTDITSDRTVIVVNKPCPGPVEPPSCPATYTDTSDNSGAIRFESTQSYTTGAINGQNGWSATGPYDFAIVPNTVYASFDSQSFRISDGATSGSFGDWVFAPGVANGAGEASATAGAFSAGTRQTHFEAQFDIASTQPCEEQSGLHISVSPDRGDGSRMSYLRFEDTAGGLDVYFDDVSGTGPISFDEVLVADNLNRSIPHKVKFVMDFVDGASNDIVKIYIDGVLVHTGTSWENYYRFDAESSAEQSPRIVKTLIFQARGTAHPANTGKGFLIDNLTYSTSNPVVDEEEPKDDTPTFRTTSGGGGNGPVNFGFVLGNGAPQGEVLGESCGIYINSHFKLGSSKNNSEQVKKLQTFLNKWLGSNIPVTGFYGPLTFAQVKKFQEKYGDDILKPWGLTTPTGIVYLSTVKKINQLECPEISLELPPLVPWSLNPNAQ